MAFPSAWWHSIVVTLLSFILPSVILSSVIQLLSVMLMSINRMSVISPRVIPPSIIVLKFKGHFIIQYHAIKSIFFKIYEVVITKHYILIFFIQGPAQ
jgi:hypothetical protein